MSPGRVRGVTGTGGMTSSSGSVAPFRTTSIADRETGHRQVEVDIEDSEFGKLELE